MAKSTLPPTTQRFVRQAPPEVKRITLALHRWMAQHRLTLGKLTPGHINHFLDSPCGRRVLPSTRAVYRRQLAPYLQYLASSKFLRFDPQTFCPPVPYPLPCDATAFIASLRPTHTRGTVLAYQQTLRALYRWLDNHQLELPRLERDHMVQWFAHLKDEGLHPSTRGQRIIHVRVYLRWLDERGRLEGFAEDLIRKTDLPKLPQYLPRPLPPDADRELQRRLAASSNVYHQALLLMRNTGLRIGELISLQRNCIRTDSNGSRFLKIPLGKLNNERLVPIDQATCELVMRLRRHGRKDRQWLLVNTKSTITHRQMYSRSLRGACAGLDIPERITTHRLRHTYATSLLNAGMSLVGVMKLLGHRSVHMTMRYAALTDHTVQREYLDAIARVEQHYRQASPSQHPAEPDPRRMLSDLARWVSMSFHDAPKRQVHALLKRIRRLQTDIQLLASR
ncbi:MAG: tyrosine-type recombinase/integrase [bacterium]|nr:tyrosine-type recombinase/integrase [bacterium]